MSAFVWLVPLLALPASAADAPNDLKIVARGDWPHLPTHAPTGIGTGGTSTYVLRDAESFAKAAGGGALSTLPKRLGVAAVDWRTQMLLAVGDGSQPLVGTSGGAPPSAPYVVTIEGVERDDANKTLTVVWRRSPRGEKDGILTRPLAAVLVEGFAGEVLFRKLPDPGAKGEVPPPAGKEVRPIARALWPDGWPPEAARQEWVVRGESGLIDGRLEAPEPVLERMRRDAKARYAKALGLDDVSFAKRMIVGVSAGVRPEGDRVEVTRVVPGTGDRPATVFWRLIAATDNANPGGVAHPAGVALVEAFAGPVTFREEPRRK